MEKIENNNISVDIAKSNSINYMYFLSFDEILSLFKNNKKHMSFYKKNYQEL